MDAASISFSGAYLPRCFSFFFFCLSKNFRSFSSSRFSRAPAFLCAFHCSCCSFKACCDFVPIPVSCVCRCASRWSRLGLWPACLTAAATAGLNLRQRYCLRTKAYTSCSFGSAPKVTLETERRPLSCVQRRPPKTGPQKIRSACPTLCP